MTRTLTFLALTALLLLSACDPDAQPSDSVEQDRIFVLYELEQEADKQETKAKATFRFGGDGGTPLFLNKKSEVTADGGKMKKETMALVNTTYYLSEIDGLPESVPFSYTNNDGKTFENTVRTARVTEVNVPGSHDKRDDLEIRWRGAQTDGEQTIVVTLTDSRGKSSTFTERLDGPQSVVTIRRSRLKKFYPGTMEVKLKREVRSEPQEATNMGGRLKASYTAREVSFNLTGPMPKDRNSRRRRNNS